MCAVLKFFHTWVSGWAGGWRNFNTKLQEWK